jgi:hypothetical protein
MTGNAFVRGACTMGTVAMYVWLGLIDPACIAPPPLPLPSLQQPTRFPSKPPVEPIVVSPPPHVTLAANRVEVVYFYLPYRCATCKCWEESSANAVATYFQEELSNGRLTFQTIEIGDRKKADLIRKYNAFASQLFVNVIRDGADQITNIKEIVYWKCGEGTDFELKVKDIIETKLSQVQ